MKGDTKMDKEKMNGRELTEKEMEQVSGGVVFGGDAFGGEEAYMSNTCPVANYCSYNSSSECGRDTTGVPNCKFN